MEKIRELYLNYTAQFAHQSTASDWKHILSRAKWKHMVSKSDILWVKPQSTQLSEKEGA
jgi:hypothetical protein